MNEYKGTQWPDTQQNDQSYFPQEQQSKMKSVDEVDAELEQLLESMTTKVKVIGCGGGGSNSIQRMMDEGIEGAEMIAINTDAQHLRNVNSDGKIIIGVKRTRGLGAGSLPQVGEDAAIEDYDKISHAVSNVDMTFIAAGMGGGTGTGSAPVVADAAKKQDSLTIAVVTLPFGVEGQARIANATAGLGKLREIADTVIVIPNDKLLEMVPNLPLQDAFHVSDEILMRSVKGITELITKPGLVNLDFADVKTVMRNGGVAMIGSGEGQGTDKAEESIRKAINSPLLDVDLSKSHAAIVNVVGSPDMTISEAESVVEILSEQISPDARIIWGAQVDPSLEDTIKTMIVATGVDSCQISGSNKSAIGNGAKKYGIDFVG